MCASTTIYLDSSHQHSPKQPIHKHPIPSSASAFSFHSIQHTQQQHYSILSRPRADELYLLSVFLQLLVPLHVALPFDLRDPWKRRSLIVKEGLVVRSQTQMAQIYMVELLLATKDCLLLGVGYRYLFLRLPSHCIVSSSDARTRRSLRISRRPPTRRAKVSRRQV